MKIIQFSKRPKELPIKVLFSVEKMIEQFEVFAQDESHPFHKSSENLIKTVKKYPRLRDGFEHLEDLEKCWKEIEVFIKPLFSEPLQQNEIKAIIMPFTFRGFHPTTRFAKILENAGSDLEMHLMEFDEDTNYIFACSFILAQYYDQYLDSSRPLFLDIPNKVTERMHSYRVLLNIDFTEIIRTENAPKVTQEDIDELLANADNITMWKKKFPIESYIFKGFGLISLYDATLDVTISKIRTLFLRNDDKVFNDFKGELRKLMGINDLMVGYSTYDVKKKQSVGTFFNHDSQSLFLEEDEKLNYEELFCESIQSCAIQNAEIIAIPDFDLYGKMSGGNQFYTRLKKKNIKSLILVPLKIADRYLQIIEVASVRKNQLNSLNAKKLEDVIPFIRTASERYIKGYMNTLDSAIQENYTSIHPSVKWRFTEAAITFCKQKIMGVKTPVLDEILFNKVYPLYGQSDIKDSSVARNKAIQADLEWQLNLIIETFQKILDIQYFPIYKKLIFRVETYLNKVKEGLDAGDEISILEFLKKEIYPVFNHLKGINTELKEAIAAYMANIDPHLHVVYRVRKAYDESVALLNDRMAAYLDTRQAKAQEMFPHYFQRYKTDGIEYNIYIGETLVNDKKFNEIYLHNLRLWQLETMWGLEQVAYNLTKEMPHPLQVASLVLVHSHPLSIKFHMDQKAFDVDGAYNARYEIIKKRIDKSHIKGTTERLTQPGKLAIVYSLNADAEEYLEYIKYWKSEGLFGKVEMLELENLQGISGLRAIRVEVLLEKDTPLSGNSKALAFNDIEV